LTQCQDNNTINVETGASLKKISEELEEYKLCFSNMSCNDETFYSILAYGIHGSSKKHGILSTMILESFFKFLLKQKLIC
jgi:dihydrodipicolinate synthase/N-acetylneuraminate lyase